MGGRRWGRAGRVVDGGNGQVDVAETMGGSGAWWRVCGERKEGKREEKGRKVEVTAWNQVRRMPHLAHGWGHVKGRRVRFESGGKRQRGGEMDSQWGHTQKGL